MKKIFNVGFVAMFAVIVLSLSCCNKYDNLADDLSKQRYFVVTNASTVNQDLGDLAVLKRYVEEINKSNTITKSTKTVVFDTDMITEKNIEGTKINFFSIPQVGLDENNTVNFGAAFLVSNGIIKYSCIVKEEKLDNNSKRITYLRSNFTPILEVYIDGEDNEITTNSIGNCTIRTRSEDGGTGECVINCIDRIYTDGGWASVIIWCASSVCWEVPAAVAITCAIECGLNFPSPGSNQ